MTRKENTSKLKSRQSKLRLLVFSADVFKYKQRNCLTDDIIEPPKLTEIKYLCEDFKAAKLFALEIAKTTVSRVSESNSHRRKKLSDEQKELHMNLMQKALTLMQEALDDTSFKMEEKLRSLRNELQSKQNTFKKVHWNKMRKIQDHNLLIVEEALSCFCSGLIDEAKYWIFEISKDYLDNYCLVSAKSVEQSIRDIANFWCDYYDYWPEPTVFNKRKNSTILFDL